MIIVGGGPAGYTAALYTARANLEPLVFEGFQWGGQLQNTTDVENYPGYPEGIMGPEMMTQFRAQAERFGTRFVTDDVDRVELSDGGVQKVFLGDEEHRAKTVILAMGAEPKRLGIPGEMELGGRGVSTCGVCDGAFFKDQKVIVIGGGDSAMEDSIFISKFASELTIVNRRDEFRASKIMLDRAAREGQHRASRRRSSPRSSSPARAASSRRSACATPRPASEEDLETDGAFVAIGHIPRSEIVKGQVDTDEDGYIVTEAGSTRTNLAGVFAVGDVVDHTYRQAVTAAGTGCMGALDAERYLRDAAAAGRGALDARRRARRDRDRSSRDLWYGWLNARISTRSSPRAPRLRSRAARSAWRLGMQLGAPADVPDLRPHRLLRQLARQTRHRPSPGDRPPDHPLGRAGRGLELVLRRRADDAAQRAERAQQRRRGVGVALLAPQALRAARRLGGADQLGELERAERPVEPSRIAVSMSSGEAISSSIAKAASLAIWAKRRPRICSAAGSICRALGVQGRGERCRARGRARALPSA